MGRVETASSNQEYRCVLKCNQVRCLGDSICQAILISVIVYIDFQPLIIEWYTVSVYFVHEPAPKLRIGASNVSFQHFFFLLCYVISTPRIHIIAIPSTTLLPRPVCVYGLPTEPSDPISSWRCKLSASEPCVYAGQKRSALRSSCSQFPVLIKLTIHQLAMLSLHSDITREAGRNLHKKGESYGILANTAGKEGQQPE
jgi:hypothetical protein